MILRKIHRKFFKNLVDFQRFVILQYGVKDLRDRLDVGSVIFTLIENNVDIMYDKIFRKECKEMTNIWGVFAFLPRISIEKSHSQVK